MFGRSRKNKDGHSAPLASIELPTSAPVPPAAPAVPDSGPTADPDPDRNLDPDLAPNADEDLVLGPLKRLATPERFAKLEAGIKKFSLAAEANSADGSDSDDDLAELAFLNLLTDEEEDAVVESMVNETVGELRRGPTEPALLEAMITLLENGFRCRVPAQATVAVLISDTPLHGPLVEGGAEATGGLISVGVVVDDGVRGTITVPYDTEAQRTLLSTVGSRLAVRVSIRDRHRIALDLETFSALG